MMIRQAHWQVKDLKFTEEASKLTEVHLLRNAVAPLMG